MIFPPLVEVVLTHASTEKAFGVSVLVEEEMNPVEPLVVTPELAATCPACPYVMPPE